MNAAPAANFPAVGTIGDSPGGDGTTCNPIYFVPAGITLTATDWGALLGAPAFA